MSLKWTFVIEYRSFTGQSATEHDRVVGVVEEVVADHLDVGVDVLLERVEPDRAEADVPVQLERAGADRGVVGDPQVPGERLGAEARADVDAAALADRVGDQVVRRPCCRCRRRSRCRWRAPASAPCCGRSVLPAFVGRSPTTSPAPSSPVLRTKLFDAAESVTPVWKLRPSAIWSTMTLFVTRQVVSSARRATCRPWCGGCRGRRSSSR